MRNTISSYEYSLTAATKGAALLDERMPGWHELISLDSLRLSDTGECVLGQLFDEPQQVPRWYILGYTDWLEAAKNFGNLNLRAVVWANQQVCQANYMLGCYVLGLNQDQCMTLGFDESAGKTHYAALDWAWAQMVHARQGQPVETPEQGWQKNG